MEEDKLKKMFQEFMPPVADDQMFMARLQRNLEAVEMVRRHTAVLRRRTRIAVVVAAVCGFAMGAILTSVMPLIDNWVSTLNLSIPSLGIHIATFDWQIVGWIVVAGASIVTAMNAYEIASTRLGRREEVVREPGR